MEISVHFKQTIDRHIRVETDEIPKQCWPEYGIEQQGDNEVTINKERLAEILKSDEDSYVHDVAISVRKN